MSSAPSTTSSGRRIVSVDALRGFTMFWIIGGNGVVLSLVGLFVSPVPEWLRAQMDHVPWEGFPAWELIMPMFLFVVGTAMPLSFAKRIESGQSKAALYRKVLVRTAILFVLGMIVQGNLLKADLSKLHLYCNTLQAIAAGYLIASVAMLQLRVVGQVLATIALLVGYWLLMMLVPVPGHGAGLLEPNSNLAMYVDELILGRFRDGTNYTWILSSMAFGGTVLLGVFSGHVLRAGISQQKKVAWLVAMGIVCLVIGFAWTQPWLGSLRFPIIKHLFTSSSVLWACGWSYLLLALFYVVIDVLQFRKWSFFFVVIGSNAILAYMAVHLISFRSIADTFVNGVARNLTATSIPWLRALGEAMGPIASFAIVWLILLYLYRKGTFVRV
jgi:predicted acyltransferase